MFEMALAMLILADLAATLNVVYWTCLVAGGGLLLLSVFGGHDADAGTDVDLGADFHADADGDFDLSTDAAHAGDFDAAHGVHGGGAAGLATWFSIRFAVFFVAVFGAIGVILTRLTTVGTTATLAIALAIGLAVGQGVHQVFRLIRRTSGDSTPQIADYVNRLARVTIAIVHPDPGEVVLQVRDTERYVPALIAGAAKRVNVGDEVVVIAYRAGVAQVVSKAEFEQQTRPR